MKAFGLAVLLGGMISLATAAVPLRVGPVSSYGTLGTSGNKVISLTTKKQVMLRGMSLFWSDATGSPYYNENVIAWATQNLGIDVFRFAMAIESYDSDGGNSNEGKVSSGSAYKTSPDSRITLLDRMVKAAIENDIYIIVDWHSHRAENEQGIAVDFFGKMAKKYANVPNIIWEVYNEPVNTDMGTIARYANAVIGAIRENGSQNLALVGTPNWSQMGSCGGVNQTNVGYVFHFYAASHSVSSYSGNVDRCMNGGNAVFITEWGTTSASGSGAVSTSEASNWTNYMEKNRISNCNWSLRHKGSGDKVEESAMFDGSSVLNNKTLLDGAKYTTSGDFVKKYLTGKKGNWNDSLTAGARSGSCAFTHVSISEMEKSKSGVGKSGCSYTSSNPAVATIGSDGTLSVLSVGYSVMTGNDGTKSVVTVEPEPDQTVGGLADFSCSLKDLKKSGACTHNFSGNSSMEYQLTATPTTNEGSTITCTSDNTAIAKVEKLTCTSSDHCYSYYKKEQWIVTITGKVGVAKMHVTAPAVKGFKALDTTVTIAVTKNLNYLNPEAFINQTLPYNGTSTEFFEDESYKIPVTYTITPEGYGQRVGNAFVAGSQDATVTIHASAPETEEYYAIDESIQIIIGKGDPSGIVHPQTMRNVGLRGYVQESRLVIESRHSGFAKVQVFGMDGRNLIREDVHYLSTGSNVISLDEMAKGAYIIKVKQGAASTVIPWRM